MDSIYIHMHKGYLILHILPFKFLKKPLSGSWYNNRLYRFVISPYHMSKYQMSWNSFAEQYHESSGKFRHDCLFFAGFNGSRTSASPPNWIRAMQMYISISYLIPIFHLHAWHMLTISLLKFLEFHVQKSFLHLITIKNMGFNLAITNVPDVSCSLQ